MKQNRPAPAYQEYAASMLANFKFRTLTLPERGALYTLRLECWANKRLPSDPASLSKILGLPRQDIESVLPALDAFFQTKDGWLFSTELDNYRAYLEEVRNARSEGGKKGAAKTNSRKHDTSADMQDTQQVACDSLDQPSKDQLSTDKTSSVINEEDSHDEWIADYEGTTQQESSGAGSETFIPDSKS